MNRFVKVLLWAVAFGAAALWLPKRSEPFFIAPFEEGLPWVFICTCSVPVTSKDLYPGSTEASMRSAGSSCILASNDGVASAIRCIRSIAESSVSDALVNAT